MATLDEYKIMIKEDVKDLDLSNLELESSISFNLWNKYHFFHLTEQEILDDLEIDLKKIFLTRWKYYLGKLDVDSLQEENEKLCKVDQSIKTKTDKTKSAEKVVKTEVKMYIEGDGIYIAAQKKYNTQKKIVECLERVTIELSKRSFYIKEATVNLQFHQGKDFRSNYN